MVCISGRSRALSSWREFSAGLVALGDGPGRKKGSSDGALLVNGRVSIFCSGLFLGTWRTNNGNTYVNVDGTLSDRQFYDIDGADSSLPASVWGSANAGYVTVTAGAHTVSIDIVAATGDTIYAWSGGINVLFVPFGPPVPRLHQCLR